MRFCSKRFKCNMIERKHTLFILLNKTTEKKMKFK